MMTKQRLSHQIISFVKFVIYLLLLFTVLALHEAIVSAKDGIQYHSYGFFIVNALVLGKVILVAEDLFAEWFREQRPIYAILAKSFAFTILLIIFYMTEEMIVRMFRGKTIIESFTHIDDGSPRSFLFIIIMFFIALIPFFVFREIGRVFGERELRSLFLTPAKRYVSHHNGESQISRD
jgi:hypothetical protein